MVGEWSLNQTSGPAIEPVTSTECMAHMRIDDGTESDYIESLITAARGHAESITRRQLIDATWVLKLDSFPASGGIIRLPRPALSSVTSITYLDTNGDSQTWSSEEYRVDTGAEPGRITEAYGYTWPTARVVTGSITITYVAGYGDEAADVPGAIRHAIKMLVSHWYEFREPVISGTIIAQVPTAVDALLSPYAIHEVW